MSVQLFFLLQLGVSSPENLRSVLSSKEDQKEAESIKRKEVPVPDSGPDSKKQFAEEDDSVETLDTSRGINPLEDVSTSNCSFH